jgi:L-seryl-tRNA(Ser) seleniumtransferase
MSDKMRLLRQLPSVDEVVEKLKPYDYPHSVVVEAVREVIDDVRYQVICGDHDEIKTEYIIDTVQQLLNRRSLLGIIKVINATGTLLHTNLGRAPLSLKTAEHITNVITGYCSLEHNLLTGKRGERGIGVEQLIKSLTGAESAVIVNNNAAAVLLTLKALAIGREVVISRGELVEIGGSFRIPEVMEQSGALLHEIGTTNMTRLSDYEKAINDNTAALMKVHTSNYKIVGFTESVSSKELAQLAHDRGLIFIDDLGSGSMINLSDYGLPKEPISKSEVDYAFAYIMLFHVMSYVFLCL